MSYTDYARPIADKLLELMETAFTTTFKHYYDGDPVYIPQQNLPCLIVDKQSAPVPGNAPTGMMRIEHTFSIQAEFDKRPEFNAHPTQTLLKKKLEQIAEGIDPETGEIGAQTIVGVLQRNFSLGQLATGQTLDIQYGLFPRGRDVLTQGVTVTGVFTELRTISNRS